MKEVWREIRESLDIGRFVGSFRDRWVWLAFLLGGIGLLFPSGGLPPLWRLAFAAMTEELAYRALLQRQLEQCVPGKWGLFTGGMLLTSALFALSHLPTHTPLMAALTFFPSLAFGALWTRHRSLWLCAAVHFWYNLLFFSRASSYPLHADTRPASKDTIKTEALEGRGARRQLRETEEDPFPRKVPLPPQSPQTMNNSTPCS
ncbi:JDVT-CTERM system glutamic-type intramembrane protease [Bilophila wadsworthia]|uniref:JDVT-CTERM system glutamic-type intramembrane protease n=1 Tax=Bilophila wadsworthia TaxID=35833 RepID=UPI00243092AA|nr:JDVT-CTERM system glutamic-type intramembrane protease [Bilophila wadsworthia]